MRPWWSFTPLEVAMAIVWLEACIALSGQPSWWVWFVWPISIMAGKWLVTHVAVIRRPIMRLMHWITGQ